MGNPSIVRTLRLKCCVDTAHMARQVWLALVGVRIRQWPAFASANGQRD
jgi:Tfp pilus assembly protein PilN